MVLVTLGAGLTSVEFLTSTPSPLHSSAKAIVLWSHGNLSGSAMHWSPLTVKSRLLVRTLVLTLVGAGRRLVIIA